MTCLTLAGLQTNRELPIGQHSSCSISPPAGGTYQKCSTKYHDWVDDAHCNVFRNQKSRPAAASVAFPRSHLQRPPSTTCSTARGSTRRRRSRVRATGRSGSCGRRRRWSRWTPRRRRCSSGRTARRGTCARSSARSTLWYGRGRAGPSAACTRYVF